MNQCSSNILFISNVRAHAENMILLTAGKSYKPPEPKLNCDNSDLDAILAGLFRSHFS